MRPALFCVLSLSLLAHAEPALQAMAPQQDTAAVPLRARLDRETIRAAIADLPAAPKDRRDHDPVVLRATPHEGFAKDVAKARLPDCLHADGLRYQPTFFLNGVLALPFIAVAKLRGVCR